MAYDEKLTEHSGVTSGDPDPADRTREMSAAPTAGEGVPGGADLEEIEAERTRRLDPANRPANAEVDNSGVHLPTVEAWDKLNPVEDVGATSDPGQAFRENPPSDDEAAAIAEERERRLDPANRPPNTEVDNTGREFRDGHFVD